MADALRTALDLTLTNLELRSLAAFDDPDEADDGDAIRLLIGDGHSGYGLYVAHPEYPEEGAILVKELPNPSGVPEVPHQTFPPKSP